MGKLGTRMKGEEARSQREDDGHPGTRVEAREVEDFRGD